MHSIQMILLITAVLVFGVALTGPTAWARHRGGYYQRPISHSNHAAIVRYYSTPYALRPPIRHYRYRPHFERRHDQVCFEDFAFDGPHDTCRNNHDVDIIIHWGQ